MTFGEFLKLVRKAGVKDEDEIFYIDFQCDAEHFTKKDEGWIIS